MQKASVGFVRWCVRWVPVIAAIIAHVAYDASQKVRRHARSAGQMFWRVPSKSKAK